MRWKYHGNVSAEMSFNLGKRSCGEGLMTNESMVCTRHREQASRYECYT
jgi:hypothetical protein